MTQQAKIIPFRKHTREELDKRDCARREACCCVDRACEILFELGGSDERVAWLLQDTLSLIQKDAGEDLYSPPMKMPGERC